MKAAFFLLLALLSVFSAPLVDASHLPRPLVGTWSDTYRSPNLADTALTPNSTFTLKINITEATEFNAYDFFLNYNPQVLAARNAIVDGSTIFGANRFILLNDTTVPGEVRVAVVSLGAFASGNGTLAYIGFVVVGFGLSNLDLNRSILVDAGLVIEHDTQDGFFSNAGFHDIAVVTVSAEPSQAIVGDLVLVRITLKNKGAFPESIQLTVNYNGTLLAAVSNVSIFPTETVSLQLQWNTTGLLVGSYVLQAAVDPVPGEDPALLADNVLATLFELTGGIPSGAAASLVKRKAWVEDKNVDLEHDSLVVFNARFKNTGTVPLYVRAEIVIVSPHAEVFRLTGILDRSLMSGEEVIVSTSWPLTRVPGQYFAVAIGYFGMSPTTTQWTPVGSKTLSFSVSP